MNRIENQITDKEAIVEAWGENFAEIADNPRIIFTDEAIFIKLKKPLKTSDGETDMLRIEEPDVAQLRSMDAVKGDVGKTAVLLANIADMPEASANKVKASDFTLFNKVLGCFLIDGPQTTEN